MSTAITNVEYTLTTTCSDTLNAAIAWTPSTPNGVSMSFSNNVATISGTPTGTATGTYNYTLTASNTAGTASATFSGSLTVSSTTASSTSVSTPSSSSLGNFQIGSLKFYNGNLYVGTHNKILKIDSSANISTYLGSGGEIDIDIDIVGESDFIRTLTFDNNGDLYFGGDKTLRKYSNNQISTILSNGVGLMGMVVSGNNEKYLVNCCANRIIQKIDQNDNVSTYWDYSSISNGSIYGIDILNNILYLTLGQDNEIITVDLNDTAISKSDLHSSNNIVDFLTSIGVINSNEFYYLSSSNNKDGKLIKVQNGVETVIINNLWSTRGLTFDDNGNLYVGDMGRIHKVFPNGTFTELINTRP